MRDNQGTVCDPDVRLEIFVAELTSAVYPLVLRRGLRDSWLKTELGLWRALGNTVKKWSRQRPPTASPQELEAWWEGLLVNLTESAFHVALKNGIKGSLQLELCLYRAVRLVTGRQIRRFSLGIVSALILGFSLGDVVRGDVKPA